MQENILIVDDNLRIYESLKPNFQHLGYKTFHAVDFESTEIIIMNKSIDVILLDIMLGEENGIDVLQKIKEIKPDIPVIMITGYASIDSAVDAMRKGAYDYVKKPLEFDRLVKIVENACLLVKLHTENKQLKRRVVELTPKICVENEQMKLVLENAEKIASSDIPVLIVGENGSGKEVVADYIHSKSNRNSFPIHKINCAAFPESLLDNELFGHEKGSYTGATSEFKGVFERSDGGILFLDEIGDMPLTIQAKILRVLQSNELRRIGGSQTIHIDARFIAATNKNLEKLIEEGLFRQDLYYRLNAAIIEVPPLRSRKEDIIPMATYFLKQFAQNSGKQVNSISCDVEALFTSYSWPGNVRELKNAVNFSVSMTNSTEIKLEDIPPKIISGNNDSNVESPLNIRERMEKVLIERTLSEFLYNKKKVAEVLKMSRKTLYTKLDKYGIKNL